MKIRTNFVTNSSSYSSAEIKIDNPVLLEILKKYKEKGAFENTDNWDFGEFIDYPKRGKSKTAYAFYYSEDEQAEVFFGPKRIEDVAECILNVITESFWTDLKNEQLFKECKKELKAREKEINDSYISVSWEASNDGYGECEPEEGEESSWKFYYKK